MTRKLSIVFFATLAFAFAFADIGKIPTECIGCICEAVSNCNATKGCEGDICGPFHITHSYWADSGKPTLEGVLSTDPNAYAGCTTDAYCSARALQGYMEKYARDCNNDGVINCDDYARIHLLGGNGCQGSLQYPYESVYTTCREQFH